MWPKCQNNTEIRDITVGNLSETFDVDSINKPMMLKFTTVVLKV